MERTDLEIRDFDARDRSAVIDLLSHDRSAHYRSMKETIFDWQFGANPHDDGDAPLFVGVADGEVVASLGSMPVRIRYKGQKQRAVWICDIYVLPAYRGRGFGTQLAFRALKRAPILLGFGISDVSDIIMARGSTLCADNRIVFFHAHEPGLKGALKNLRTRLASRQARISSPEPIEVSRHEGDFGIEFNELWQRAAPGYVSIVERDAAVLTWKYRKHPVHRYIAYVGRRNGQLSGLVVARHHHKTSLLVDYSGPADDIDLMCALAGAATADLVARGTCGVRCETTHRPLLSALRRIGFVSSRYRSRFRIRTGVQNDDGTQHGWFLMSGDSDGDMLDDGH